MNFIKYFLLPLIEHPLNKDNKLMAILNFLHWQLKLRIIKPYEVIAPFIGHTKFIVNKGRTGFTGNLYCGLHEFFDMAFLLHYLRSEDIMFDVGANVGSYSILSASFIGAKTYSFEPVPYTYELLNDNRLINGNVSNWQTKKIALGNIEGELYFSVDRDTENSIVSENYSGKKELVKIDTIDRFCSEENVIPSFLKIDAEGFDEQVVKGSSNVLSLDKVNIIIIESDSEWVQSMLESVGFSPYTYDPFNRTLKVSRTIQGNQLYIKNIELATSRVRSANSFEVKGYSI